MLTDARSEMCLCTMPCMSTGTNEETLLAQQRDLLGLQASGMRLQTRSCTVPCTHTCALRVCHRLLVRELQAPVDISTVGLFCSCGGSLLRVSYSWRAHARCCKSCGWCYTGAAEALIFTLKRSLRMTDRKSAGRWRLRAAYFLHVFLPCCA